jgi:hypothetical protein
MALSLRHSSSQSTKVSRTLLDKQLNHSIVEVLIISILRDDNTSLHDSEDVRAADIDLGGLPLSVRLVGESDDHLFSPRGKLHYLAPGPLACDLVLLCVLAVNFDADDLFAGGVAGEGELLVDSLEAAEGEGGFVAGGGYGRHGEDGCAGSLSVMC